MGIFWQKIDMRISSPPVQRRRSLHCVVARGYSGIQSFPEVGLRNREGLPRTDIVSPACQVRKVPCVDVYGPRPIATGRLDQDRGSQLLTYIRLRCAAE